MSCLTILTVCPEAGTNQPVADLQNSWGGGVIAWTRIWDTYGEKRHEYDHALTAGNRLWDLQHDRRLTRAERVLFCLTFDRFYVKRADYTRMADDLTEAFDGAPEGHWPEIIRYLRSAPEADATGFWWTSVAENPFDGEWDEGLEEYRPIDPALMVNVYDHVARLEAEGQSA